MAEIHKLLIVDDDPDIRDLISQILDPDKYELVLASNGQEALDEVHRQRFDLIVMDLMMPGMSGIEVCQLIKQEPDNLDIPIVMLTAKTGISDRIDGFMTGAEEYITKPFDPMKLEARIETILRRIDREHNQ